MPMRVDLPAPFGPSRPMMSPARASSDTCETARRLPKCRDTSTSRTASKLTIRKSCPRSGGAKRAGVIGIVERAVDVFELRHQFLAASQRAIVAASSTPLALDLHELAEQLLASCMQAFAVRFGRAAVRPARADPDAAEDENARNPQRRIARHGAVVWKIGQR